MIYANRNRRKIWIDLFISPLINVPSCVWPIKLYLLPVINNLIHNFSPFSLCLNNYIMFKRNAFLNQSVFTFHLIWQIPTQIVTFIFHKQKTLEHSLLLDFPHAIMRTIRKRILHSKTTMSGWPFWPIFRNCFCCKSNSLIHWTGSNK